MNQRVSFCICGGGNLGHVIAGVLSARGDCEVSLLTRRPDQWRHRLTVRTPDGHALTGTIKCISDCPEVVIPAADIVLLCLPGYSIRETLLRIKPFLAPGTAVGSIVSSTGFFFEAMDVLPPSTPLFGYQRVPFIARTTVYGQSADLLGYKPSLSVAIEQTDAKEPLRATLERLFNTPTALMQSHYEVSLTNSNPLLHPSRLYTQWKDWSEGIVYPRQTYFYREWTDEASALLMEMDNEFQQLLKALPVREGSIPTILDYYESTDAPSLTRKLRSIEAFKGILSPMQPVEGGYVPDFRSRYFTEDFPFGLRIVQQQAERMHVDTPTIAQVMAWGSSKLLATRQDAQTAHE